MNINLKSWLPLLQLKNVFNFANGSEEVNAHGITWHFCSSTIVSVSTKHKQYKFQMIFSKFVKFLTQAVRWKVALWCYYFVTSEFEYLISSLTSKQRLTGTIKVTNREKNDVWIKQVGKQIPMPFTWAHSTQWYKNNNEKSASTLTNVCNFIVPFPMAGVSHKL